MPYKGENERFSMYIFLPDKTQLAISKLLDGLTQTILNDVFNGSFLELKRHVIVRIPKFSFDQKTELKELW